MFDWKILFKIMMQDKEILFEFIYVMDETIFENAVLSNLFLLIKKFVSKHKKQPDEDTLLLLIEQLPDIEKENKSLYISTIHEIFSIQVTISPDIFKEEMYRQMKKYDLERLILRSASNVSNLKFEDMMEDIRSLMTKYRPKSFGIDVTKVENAIKMIKGEHIDKITSGVNSLDKLLAGGFSTGELSIIMAPPGKGKSFFLLNMMYGAMLSQKNVLYMTFELYEKTVLKRLYSRISYSSKKEMLDEAILTKSINKFFTLSKSNGRILYAPSKSVTVEELESMLESQAIYFGFVPDIIVVDYLDLMAPRKSDLRLETRHRLRGVAEDLRSFAIRRNLPIVSATQSNRASLSKSKITEANVSESFGKIEVSDVVIAVCQTDEEKKMKRARLVVLKNRDYVSGGSIEVYVDFERMIMMDIDVADKLGLLQKDKNDTVG